ncbi:MAG: hypothetical protein R3F29_14020 [Planctomycetota bacterium]
MRFIAAAPLFILLLASTTLEPVGPRVDCDLGSPLIAAQVEDCLVSGLIFSTGGGVFPPILMDNGTVMGTNGAGCDGCTVRWNVTVTWMENGNGTTEVSGIKNWGPVRFGDETTLTSPTIDIVCDSETVLKVTGHGGQWAQFKVQCKECL